MEDTTDWCLVAGLPLSVDWGLLESRAHLADLSLLGPTEGSGHSGTSGWMETAPVNE